MPAELRAGVVLTGAATGHSRAVLVRPQLKHNGGYVVDHLLLLPAARRGAEGQKGGGHGKAVWHRGGGSTHPVPAVEGLVAQGHGRSAWVSAVLGRNLNRLLVGDELPHCAATTGGRG